MRLSYALQFVMVRDKQHHKAVCSPQWFHDCHPGAVCACFRLASVAQRDLLRAKVLELKQQVSEQELSAADVQRMAKERTLLKDQLQKHTEQRENAQKQVWEQEMQLAKKLDGMQAELQQYHEIAHRLHLVPMSARNANGMDFEVRLNTASLTAGLSSSALSGFASHVDGRGSDAPLLEADIKGTLRPALRALKSSFTTRAHEKRSELADIEDQVETGEEKLEQKRRAIRSLDAKVKKLEEVLKKEKSDAAEEQETLDTKLEELEGHTEEVRAAVEKAQLTAERIREIGIEQLTQEYVMPASVCVCSDSRRVSQFGAVYSHDCLVPRSLTCELPTSDQDRTHVFATLLFCPCVTCADV